MAQNLNGDQLTLELMNLIAQYNQKFDSYMLVYATDTDKDVPPQRVALGMRDYQILFDMLQGVERKKLDFYLETPGGSGEAAEEIVRLTRRNFGKVNFVIAGECKSAGTLMALSGNEIYMTDSGSLGPIDAQMHIGRSQISAHDYMKWVEDKQKAYSEEQSINPFDAILVAQISPGELIGVENALNYAHDLVTEWLPKYKFSGWARTESRRIPVTEKMKKERAKEISEALSDHTTWRTHGRSLKLEDLNRIKLKAICIDDDKERAELVYRIHAVVRMLFLATPIFKIYATEKDKLFESAAPITQTTVPVPGQQDTQLAEIQLGCTKCGKPHNFYVRFEPDTQIEEQMKAKGVIKLPAEGNYTCDNCNNIIELDLIRNQLESQTGKKVL